MITCRRCGANCDNGEMIGGICTDCLEDEKDEQIRASNFAKLINSPSYQMELNLEVMRNGK